MEINMQLAWNYYVALNEPDLEMFYLLAVFFLLEHLQMCWVVPTWETVESPGLSSAWAPEHSFWQSIGHRQESL